MHAVFHAHPLGIMLRGMVFGSSKNFYSGDEAKILCIKLVIFAGWRRPGFDITPQQFTDYFVYAPFLEFAGQLIEVGVPSFDKFLPCIHDGCQGDRAVAVAVLPGSETDLVRR